MLCWSGPALHLLVRLTHLLQGNLAAVDALLGCPLALVPPEIMLGEDWEKLPSGTQAGVLAAVFHSVSWLREVLNAFGPLVSIIAGLFL